MKKWNPEYLNQVREELAVVQTERDALRETVDVLRAEVLAWRAWRKLVVRYMTCEQPDPTVKIDALKDAMTATDAAKALEET